MNLDLVLGYFGHNFGVWFRFGIAFEQRFGPDLVYNNSLNLVFSISIWPVVILDTDLVSGVDLLHGVFIDIMVVASGLGKQKRR